MSRQSTAHHFGIYHHRLEFSVFHHLKFRHNDLHFFRDALPVEERFHFSTCQKEENTVVCFHRIEEHIGEPCAPELEHRFSIVVRQHHIPLQTIIFDTIERSRQSIEERRHPQMLLRISKVFGRKIACAEVTISHSRVGKHRSLRSECWEICVALLIECSQLRIYFEQLCQFLSREFSHLRSVVFRFS